MTEQVIYELGLRDKLSAGIDGANSHVKSLESTLGSVKGLLTGIGIGLAAFKLGEFVSEANEEWEKMEFAMSQVEAGIKSTGGAAGLTFEELKQGAADASHNIKFTQSAILDMQSVLLTFPQVTKETFGEASAIIEDMSTRLGTDLKSSAIQVGKALQDPIKGITALRRVGVNFNEQQTETIKHLAETNQLAKAQALILQELQIEFGGSALAAAEADKGFRLDKTMEENKVILGEFIDQIKEELMPALIAVANAFKSMIVWVKKNWEGIKTLTLSLGAAYVAFKAMTIIPGILLSIENALVSAAVAGTSFGASMTAALGPVGLLAVAIGGLVYAYRQLEQYQQKKEQYLSDVAKDEEDFVQQGMEKYKGQKNARQLAIDDEAKDIATRKKMYQDMIKEINPEGKPEYAFAGKYQIMDNLIAYGKELEILDAREKGLGQVKNLVPTKSGGKAVAAGGKILKDPSTKATGSKSVTINVTIQKLGETHLSITNIKEGAKHIHDAVTKALTGAVNDFQVIANNS